jgi:hypothetical protein
MTTRRLVEAKKALAGATTEKDKTYYENPESFRDAALDRQTCPDDCRG